MLRWHGLAFILTLVAVSFAFPSATAKVSSTASAGPGLNDLSFVQDHLLPALLLRRDSQIDNELDFFRGFHGADNSGHTPAVFARLLSEMAVRHATLVVASTLLDLLSHGVANDTAPDHTSFPNLRNSLNQPSTQHLRELAAMHALATLLFKAQGQTAGEGVVAEATLRMSSDAPHLVDLLTALDQVLATKEEFNGQGWRSFVDAIGQSVIATVIAQDTDESFALVVQELRKMRPGFIAEFAAAAVLEIRTHEQSSGGGEAV